MKSAIDILFEEVLEEQKKKRKKKKPKTKVYVPLYYPLGRYTEPQPPATEPPETGGGETPVDAGGGDTGSTDEAMSSTERMRRFNKRHPEKVRAYLKKTQDDRVARNRDRRKAVKKHGKAKMKNHDVHHPNGPHNGGARLVQKDHGRDKKNENIEYVYLSELMEGNVPNGPWILLSEGGAAGHMAHPYEDNELTFRDVKEMVRRGLVGELDAEEPVTEKLDGQNIMFSVRDGRVVFARNKGQVRNKGKNALDTAGIRQMFAGRGNIEKAFTGAAEDLQRAIDALPQEQRDAIFAGGSKFMNVEIILPDTQNVIPYGKSVLVFHGSVEYDDEGNELGRSTEDGKTLSDQITKVNAQQQRTFGISGPKTISFSDAQTVENKRALKELGRQIARLQQEYDLDDNSTIEDYKLAWWGREIDGMGIDWTPEEREGLINRWALGDKSFKVTKIEDPAKKKFVKQFEATELKRMQQRATSPLERVFLTTGALSLRRVTDLLAANNPEAAAKLKQEVLDTIKELRNTDDANKLAALQIQIERLESVGIDKIVPSEGMVFIYNGKPYKFTGAFAPVNQILGTLKFAKGEAEMAEPPEERPNEAPPLQRPTKPGERRTVAIFSGRFQPFHAGHYSVYQSLVQQFGKENVFIATSDKTDPTKSPFGFDDKEQIITQMFDIPEDMVVQVKNPYAPVEILGTLPPETAYVTAVSQKDAERLGGGKYFKPYDPETSTGGYKDTGYFIVAPEMQLQLNGKNISGTQVRALLGDPKISDKAKKEIFTKIYGTFNPEIFKKIVKITTDSEEALKLTKQHGGKPAVAPSKGRVQPKKPTQPARPKKAPTPTKAGTDFHKAGDTWPAGDKFAGKNKKGRIRYFNTAAAAKKFATS